MVTAEGNPGKEQRHTLENWEVQHRPNRNITHTNIFFYQKAGCLKINYFEFSLCFSLGVELYDRGVLQRYGVEV